MTWFRPAALLASTALCGALVACATTEHASDEAASTLGLKGAEIRKAQPVFHAQDWDQAATSIAAGLLASLQQMGMQRHTGVHIAAPVHMSAFDRGFKELLTSKLVNSGALVQTQPDRAALELVYQSHFVEHRDAPFQELILGAAVRQNGQYLAHQSRLYYLANADVGWFEPVPAGHVYPNSSFQVVGP